MAIINQPRRKRLAHSLASSRRYIPQLFTHGAVEWDREEEVFYAWVTGYHRVKGKTRNEAFDNLLREKGITPAAEKSSVVSANYRRERRAIMATVELGHHAAQENPEDLTCIESLQMIAECAEHWIRCYEKVHGPRPDRQPLCDQ